MVLLRMVFQPGPNEFVDLKFGILLALIGALLVAYGGWESMQEEGTTFDDARDQLQAQLMQRRRRPARPARPQPAAAPTRAGADATRRRRRVGAASGLPPRPPH